MMEKTRVLVLYYSMYGHIEALAQEVAAGAAEVEGVEVVIKRVPELIPEEQARQIGIKLDQKAPVATVEELPEYDAIIVGTPTRFGNMAAQMRNFWDQTGPLWLQGALIGKVGSAFTATATQHAGHESTILSIHTTLLHHGMIIVGVPTNCVELTQIDEVAGGSPYGAGVITGGDGSRMPSEIERRIARVQGRHVAQIARQLKVGRLQAQAA
ncbi:NAD(P)H dehydrogenase (quinone) [Rhodothermus profundi]|uniref:NAD(P)H dehydrogenase (quinone) n=2 Tax=Rhodothermus profundi TaxID=633813 RepID=A0A1M6QPA7_9BACT|nr:NAD(P)H dehydrogenase (quinone) [Rhodothermus profundi]